MESAQDVILYTHKVSPYAQRVHVAMVEKGIPFKPVYVDLLNKPKEFLEANPIYGQVPTLVHGKNSICESLVILEYLEEAWPETTPLLPKDCVARAKTRFWADYTYKGFSNMRTVAVTKPNTPEREAAMLEYSKFLKTLEETMIEYSAEGPFFTGDKFHYLDVILLPLACWGHVLDMLQAPLPGPDELPRLHKWIKAIRKHKSYTEVIVSDEEIMEYFKAAQKRRAEAAAAAAAANGN